MISVILCLVSIHSALVQRFKRAQLNVKGEFMPTIVKGSALAIGDVIQDEGNTGDTHPYLVISKTQWVITLRNCTSFETSALTLVKVLKEDKTGDALWSTKDSFVVKSGNTKDLNVYNVVTVDDGFIEQTVPSLPVPRVFMGEFGPYMMWVSYPVIVSVPRQIDVYSDIMYRVVGTVKSSRMESLLMELAE